MTSFVALYRGSTVATSEVVALSADPYLVNEVARKLTPEEIVEPTTPTPERPYAREGELRLVPDDRDDA